MNEAMTDTALYYWIASAVAVVGLLIHVGIGGKAFVRPMFNSNMEEINKWITYICWHSASLMFLGYVLGFAYAASQPDATLLVMACLYLSSTSLLLFFYLALFVHRAIFRLPGLYLMTAITLFGILGITAQG